MTNPVMYPLRGQHVLEVSTKASGVYAGWLLEQLGASVTRLDLPMAVDCPADSLKAFDNSLNGTKNSIAAADRTAIAHALGSANVLLLDSRHDDALDGEAVRLTAGILSKARLGCAIVDVSGHRERKEAGSIPATPLTESAAAAMSWSLGHPDRAPLALPADIPDYLAGTEAAGAAALAMLLHQADSSVMQEWDVSATDVLATYVGQICSNFLPYERPWQRDGARASMSGGSYPAAMFACRDGHVSIMCRTPREWHGLLRAMGDPAWSRDERFRDGRVVARFHADEADGYLKAWTLERTRDEIFELGKEFSFPIAPVLTVGESLDLEHFAERGFLTPTEEGAPKVSQPWKIIEPPDGPRFLGTGRPSWTPAKASLDAPLAGLRVLDLSWVWSGPMVTAALGDLGADVLKVENRERADPARLRGAALRDGVPVEGPELEVTPYFNQMNRGKKSIAVDISTPEGVEIILDLAAECDVVVENMRPGALDRRGLGYQELAERNPGLIMLSMSLMGQTGPMRTVGGYAPVMSGLAGLDSMVGYGPEDLIGLYNPALGDPNGAAHALTVLLAALVGRQQTNKGCWIDLAQVEAMVSIQRAAHIESQRTGTSTVMGNSHSTWWPHGTWKCTGEDEWIAVAARTDAERARLAELTDGEPATNEELTSALESWLSTRPADDAVKHLRALGIAANPVWSFAQMVDSDWARERQLGHTVHHPYLGDQRIFGLPWKCNGRGFAPSEPAPLLGSNTDSVLANVLGLSETTIGGLRRRKVIE